MLSDKFVTWALVGLHVAELQTMAISKHNPVNMVVIVAALSFVLNWLNFDFLSVEFVDDLLLVAGIDGWFGYLLLDCHCENKVFLVLHANFLFFGESAAKMVQIVLFARNFPQSILNL